VEKTQIGPRVIRYWVKLQPPAGRLAEVQKYAIDLARELGSKSIPLIDNIPGERYIGIDLAHEQPQIMPLTPALATLPEHQSDSLLIAMGVNAAGQHIQEDLVKMPHMLVAGTTGSGKTMFLTSFNAWSLARSGAGMLQFGLGCGNASSRPSPHPSPPTIDHICPRSPRVITQDAGTSVQCQTL
jgi:S-DNA-T family DNA segregation ATPase FtsK/SpoIIIE